MNITGLAEFNLLVRGAHNAQEDFDRFDPDGSPEHRQLLLRKVQDWDLANVALIDFVMRHGQELLEEIDDHHSKDEADAR